jgi:glutamate-5-semialdehyde dehydrogenase
LITDLAQQAKQASLATAALSPEQKNAALQAIVRALNEHQELIFTANQQDLDRAAAENLTAPLLKRLKFDAAKLAETVAGIESLIQLPDPVGQTLQATELAPDLNLYKVTTPIGVLGIVFESRPDALVQISTLALKSSNTVLLKGGSEAEHTNRTLARIINDASRTAGLPAGWLTLLETRADVNAMLALDEYIDLIIPRGSNAFVRHILDNTRIPVLGHADGICHLYIDSAADLTKALDIAFDSKCQYPAVCNALETLLVHTDIAGEFLPAVKTRYDSASVELRGDEPTRQIIACNPASDEDWSTEYNDLILSIKTVPSLDTAIDHINRYSSHHTDAIVTENPDTARRFLALVDSAGVFWNASTRFADGYRYGLGAEVGISTNKIHARGPVGLEGLTLYKYLLLGKNHTVAQFSGPHAQSFTHQPLNQPYPL